MIYTIGHEKSYLHGIEIYGIENFMKLGKQPKGEEYPDGYSGGYAFRTFEDATKRIAEAYKDMGFAVFGLLADWENDTESSGHYWHYLLFSRDIVLVDEFGNLLK